MNNLLVLPMVLPLIIGVLLVFIPSYITIQRWTAFIVLAVNASISFLLLQQIVNNGIITLDFGDWEAPFGITFVGDAFSMLLVVTTNLVSAICVLYAMKTIGLKRVLLYFYAFFLFLVSGDDGSFLCITIFIFFD